jgi:hypothetical protein
MKRAVIAAFDAIASVAAYPAALLMAKIRKIGVHRLPRSRRALERAGVFPIRDHYYEPQFNYRDAPLSTGERVLPGIDWNVPEQLSLLSDLRYADEVHDWTTERVGEGDFSINNGLFGSGDAEFWYQLIRHIKPRRIFEIGSGNSTLVAVQAVRRNAEESAEYSCKHVCIEPFEAAWLERTGVSVVREQVERLPLQFFDELQRGDILFIDSSHVIRPHGDVTFEYLTLLPALRSGVIVHVHDIFSPRNYPEHWVVDEVRLWNEQYLLEAFLTHNASWKVMAALNDLKHHHYDRLQAVAPFLRQEREPGSFYMQKI